MVSEKELFRFVTKFRLTNVYLSVTVTVDKRIPLEVK